MFDHLSDIRKSFPGRITAETFKKQVLGVVEVWEDWIVFPPDFTGELRQRLDGRWGKANTSGAGGAGGAATGDGDGEETGVGGSTVTSAATNFKFKSSSFKPAMEPVIVEAPPGVVEDDVDGMEVDGDDLEGEAMPMDFGLENGTNGRA